MLSEQRRADWVLESLQDEGWDGRFCLQYWRDAEREKLINADYRHDKSELEEQACWNVERRAYGAALLWELDETTEEWREIRSWP